ncbi:MAG: hypothetical protein AB7F23_10045 [Phycisphaerae bacterium]
MNNRAVKKHMVGLLCVANIIFALNNAQGSVLYCQNEETHSSAERATANCHHGLPAITPVIDVEQTHRAYLRAENEGYCPCVDTFIFVDFFNTCKKTQNRNRALAAPMPLPDKTTGLHCLAERHAISPGLLCKNPDLASVRTVILLT